MITFKKLRWKNFLSTGNQYTEINFTLNSTNLIIGTNGAGKSTVLDALTFSLFGKPFRKINKAQLINSVNEKDCVVEVYFLIGNTEWKVVRGIKPNIFQISRNDKVLDQTSSAIDQQKWLEQTILKMNYKSFTQIVILGSTAFVPFMQLSAAHRREVIEDLLDIKIFSSMNMVIKEKIRQIREEIKTLDLKKESLFDKVEMQKNFIEELENRGNAKINDNQQRISNLDSEFDIYMRENSSLEESIFKYIKEQEEVTGASDKLRKLGNLKGKISQKVSGIDKEHKFFTENTVCPTCTQDIDEKFRLDRIDESQLKQKELQLGYQELEKTIKDEEERERQFTILSKEITKLTHEISQNNTKIFGCQRQIKDLESEIQKITSQFENRNTENEKLESFRESLQKTYDELAIKKDLINHYDFAYGLLKDGGVKSKIIKKYLPLMNQQVNRYLQMLDFYINFTLDDEFNETIQSPIHEDFTYESFSEGEKMRINLAILFTWREIARMKNSINTNLLILDEVFDSSLDNMGTEYFTKIIKHVIKDSNIFVISHKTDELLDKFDKIVRFEKIKGFSKIAP
jgi:DNA repair exonuclease SbcCD ATPase subunit